MSLVSNRELEGGHHWLRSFVVDRAPTYITGRHLLATPTKNPPLRRIFCYNVVVQKKSTIYFHGGAGSVTGSHFLLDTGGAKILIDCGLFQGRKEAEASNWTEFPYDPASIDYLINTHAHIDHIGRIPFLVKRGFKGKIISTEATK